jgi:hypothetical protein
LGSAATPFLVASGSESCRARFFLKNSRIFDPKKIDSEHKSKKVTGLESSRQNPAKFGARICCEDRGREFVLRRSWQRGCGSSACRAAASRRRRADELRNELEGIANALDRDDVDAARAKLQTLISTLREKKRSC